MNSDFRDLLSLFNAGQVKYLGIGIEISTAISSR
jgi:hypothetical protein